MAEVAAAFTTTVTLSVFPDPLLKILPFHVPAKRAGPLGAGETEGFGDGVLTLVELSELSLVTFRFAFGFSFCCGAGVGLSSEIGAGSR